ncbi:BON domain-containing protein [Acinetobacter ursingii]|uniref:BON domain-containing protein n=1 Tax=Acinetobacter ursingii TaxID=108980 RepID=UPI0012503F58|nr:BON domain-containing protein [Acinetobacter ursingii]
MFKRIAITALCVASLSGCASFISGGTGSAPVGTESGARSLGQVFIDSSIKHTASINLYKLDPRFKQSRVNIESFHSNVLLTGQVPDEHLRQLAEDNVKSMSDVKTVHNYITVGPQVSYSTIMQDSAVTANTRGLLVRAPVVSDTKVLVHTEDGVLYVMGRLNTAEINDLNDVLQKVGNVTKIVTLIDNIDQPNAGTTASSLVASPMVGNATAQPEVQTPVAIDPDQGEPVNAQ